ncbi:cyclic nucleotide-binding domain-containing protein [Sinirhodobacter sp. WL0062]|uniref:Cyclic nucleotide-binding domain-containing protein n=1 Tax=Rhodobacter flavimaris TaxID=2907145 RepID=A0ABS8YYT0_9RHOB|nr:cyclic nucleotide-binding domain-containing protein [Sinirhodobacter sp. WL0062]MCE5974977.1 cyclic nucleotide-binding domain-containing protein [Sinirhodobacter sp. WL0062]
MKTRSSLYRIDQLSKAILAGVISGILVSFYAISFAFLIFANAAPSAIPIGFWVTFAGQAVASIFAIIGWRQSNMIWQGQSIVVVTLAGIAVHYAASEPALSEAQVTALILAAVMLATLSTGLVMCLVGWTRSARFVKNVPFPVVSGFLTATGVLLLINAAGLVLPRNPGWPEVFAAETLARWSLPMLLAVAMVLLKTHRAIEISVPLATVAVAGVTYLIAALSDGGLAEALKTGMFLQGKVPLGTHIGLPHPEMFADFPTRVFASEIPNLLVVAGLSLLGMLLNLSAVELSSGRTIDLDAEVGRAGLSNLVAGLTGGVVAYQSATLSFLSRDIAPGAGRLLPVTAMVTAVVIGVIGIPYLAYVPSALIVFLLSYLGFGLLTRWFISELPRLTPGDIVTIVVIVAITLLNGLLLAVIVGIALAALNFTIGYSRLPIFRSRTTAEIRRSTTERSAEAEKLLDQAGKATRIYELQGYLFFGTVTRMYKEVRQDLAQSDVAVRHVILDFRRVLGTEVSATLMVVRLARSIREIGADLIVTAMPEALSREQELGGEDVADRSFATLNDALAWVEDLVLDEAHHLHSTGDSLNEPIRCLLDRIEQAVPGVSFPSREICAGADVFRIGEKPNGFVCVESGRLVALTAGRAGSEVQIASYLPGAIVGEMAVFSGAGRSATVRAQSDAVVRLVSQDALDQLGRARPDLAVMLLSILGKRMAARLSRTTALLYSQ